MKDTTLRTLATLVLALASCAGLSCGGGGSSSQATPACDAKCRDAVALLGLRDAIKLVYNLTLAAQSVGDQDASLPMCPLGGSASVSGQATSNGVQGATEVDLVYVFDHCAFSSVDTDPTQVFSITLTGTITELGTIAVQPSATTSLTLESAAMSIAGTVYSPPIAYDANGDAGPCAIMLGQSGNAVSGTLCGRSAGVSL
jgi:hypothetical protein